MLATLEPNQSKVLFLLCAIIWEIKALGYVAVGSLLLSVSLISLHFEYRAEKACFLSYFGWSDIWAVPVCCRKCNAGKREL